MIMNEIFVFQLVSISTLTSTRTCKWAAHAKERYIIQNVLRVVSMSTHFIPPVGPTCESESIFPSAKYPTPRKSQPYLGSNLRQNGMHKSAHDIIAPGVIPRPKRLEQKCKRASENTLNSHQLMPISISNPLSASKLTFRTVDSSPYTSS
jgi:hypothetical protein